MIAAADNPNLAILEMAVQALGELTHSLVFVGGARDRIARNENTRQPDSRHPGRGRRRPGRNHC